jgi:alpha-beta hydrolase superfamily lysophospholipase
VFRHASIAALLVLLLAAAAAAASTQDVSFRTDDGVTIVGTLFLPGHPGPGVMLLHALSRTREDWHATAGRLADAGLVVLSIDLRGHGGSGPLPEGSSLDELTKMMADVRAARGFLASRREVAPNRIGIAGASIGANLAILLAANDPTVRSLVLLSPGIDYRGLRPEAALRKYADRPALIVASQEDNYSANSARQLAGSGPGVRDLRLLNGAGHGTNMLARQPDLVGAVVDWFRRTLL